MGRIYYVNHNERTTTWQRPTQAVLEAQQHYQQQQTGDNLARAQQMHNQRNLDFATGSSSTSSSANDPNDGRGPLPAGGSGGVEEDGSRTHSL